METPSALTPTRTKLVTIGKRERSLVGFTHAAFEEHLFNHITTGSWCDVSCAARTFLTRDTAKNQRAIRQKLRRAQRRLIDRQQFLVVEYAATGHGAAQRFKLYEGKTDDERQATYGQLERMRQRREVDEATYEKARAIVAK